MLDKINVKIKRYNITIKIFNKILFDQSINVTCNEIFQIILNL